MNMKLSPLILLAVVLTCCSTAQSDVVTLHWTAPTHYAIPETCEPDTTRPIENDYAMFMVLQVRALADTAWDTAKTYTYSETPTDTTWSAGQECAFDISLTPGIWQFRVACYVLSGDTCWSNVAESEIRIPRLPSVVDLREVE